MQFVPLDVTTSETLALYRKFQSNSTSYQYIDGLNHVNKDLVFFVFDTLRSPGDSVGDGGRHLGLCYFQLGTLLSDISANNEMAFYNATELCIFLNDYI